MGFSSGRNKSASVELRSLRLAAQPLLKCFLPALVVAFIAAVLYYLQRDSLVYLSTYNRDMMVNVFRGDHDVWVVLCQNGQSREPLPPNFVELSRVQELAAAARFGVLNCEGTLPSGKSVLEKFGITPRESPQITLFVAGAGFSAPQQLPVSKGETFLAMKRWLAQTVTPRTRTITSTRDLATKCLAKSACVVIMKTDSSPVPDLARDAIKHAMYADRAMRFVTIDASQMELSVSRKVGYHYNESHPEPGVLLFLREKGSTQTKKNGASAKDAWVVHVFDGEARELALSEWISQKTGPNGGGGGTKIQTGVSLKKRKLPSPPKERSKEGASENRRDQDAEAATAQILRQKEELRIRQEQARRRQMDAEVEHLIQESNEEEQEEVEEEEEEEEEEGEPERGGDAVEQDRERGDSHFFNGEGETSDDVVDLDDL